MSAVPIVYNDLKYILYKLNQLLPKVPKQVPLISSAL